MRYKFADLKPGMRVHLESPGLKRDGADASDLRAYKPFRKITASMPEVEGLLLEVDTTRNTLGIGIKLHADSVLRLVWPALPVSNDAKVIVNGKVAKLADLKEGMHVLVELQGEMSDGRLADLKHQRVIVVKATDGQKN